MFLWDNSILRPKSKLCCFFVYVVLYRGRKTNYTVHKSYSVLVFVFFSTCAQGIHSNGKFRVVYIYFVITALVVFNTVNL